MYLDKKLFFRVSKNKVSCFCGNIEEVSGFLSRELNYQLSEIERQTIDYLMQSILPLGKDTQKRERFLLVSNEKGQLGEFSEHEKLPYGWRKLATVFSDAFTVRSNPVAKFELNPGDDLFYLDVSRFRSDESMPIRIAEAAWSQQAEAFCQPEIPYVMADISKLRRAGDPEAVMPDTYVLKIGDDKFYVHSADDVFYILKQLMRGEPDKAWLRIIPNVFKHLQEFPKEKFFHESVNIYVDSRKYFFVGGDGKISTRRFRRCGVFYPEYFCGGPGPLLRLKTDAVEDVLFDFFLFRPDAHGQIPERK